MRLLPALVVALVAPGCSWFAPELVACASDEHCPDGYACVDAGPDGRGTCALGAPDDDDTAPGDDDTAPDDDDAVPDDDDTAPDDDDVAPDDDDTATDDDDTAPDDDDTAPDDDDAVPDDDDATPPPPAYSAGDLVITELLINPAGTDEDHEWFEVHNPTASPVDLAGWTISDDAFDAHTIEGPLIVPAGGYAVLGDNADTATNGGAPVDYSYADQVNLSNSSDELYLDDAWGTRIETLIWNTADGFPATQGAASSLDTDALSAAANDDPTSWCESPAGAFGTSGDLGSPGAPNPACPLVPIVVAGIPFLPVEADTFEMGCTLGQQGHCGSSEQPAHSVTLTHDFWLMETELTQGAWSSMSAANPSNHTACGDLCPVERVDWWEALDFANTLSSTEGLDECFTLQGCTGTIGTDFVCTGFVVNSPTGSLYDCEGYRLPTEAEWEYAARAGVDLLYAGANTLDLVAWCDINSNGETHEVGGRDPNSWGFYDLSGNVAEWVWDVWSSYTPSAETDPEGPGGSGPRCYRGGDFDCTGSNGNKCRVSDRRNYGPDVRDPEIGLRLARTMP